jgi:hypothetical protein
MTITTMKKLEEETARDLRNHFNAVSSSFGDERDLIG